MWVVFVYTQSTAVNFDLPVRRALHTLRARLLAWFYSNRRDLPWRATRDPYRIWVSEVMLQQTTVAAVVPYFERFMATLPNLRALAGANEQVVLKLWEGLGYYRRARHLHAAAKQLVAEHGGKLPNDPDAWIALPGVGRYILGAVLSQAFDHRLPIVEANSLRVLARLFGYRGDPREGEGKAWVWSTAEAVLPTKSVGDFNQALMELGALICTPTAPDCRCCPLARHCVTKKKGLQLQIPPPVRQPAVTRVSEIGVVIRKGSRVLLCQRRADASRWQNMWEIPHAERTAEEDEQEAVRRIAKDLTGIAVEPGDEILTVKHAVTRFAITLVCVEAKRKSGDFAPSFYQAAKWVTQDELTAYPVSAPQRRLMNALAKHTRRRRLA
jgi:A/G-specific adenine glycosylase